MSREVEMRQVWERSFADQIAHSAYNTAAVESLVRTVSHYLRPRVAVTDYPSLHFMEVGCGAGPNLVWLAEKGIRISGVDISPTALELARDNLMARGLSDRVEQLVEGSATRLPFADESLDGVLESCVFQHLARDERILAFSEVVRVLKPGGVFVGNMLGDQHSTFLTGSHDAVPRDPGTVLLKAEGTGNAFNLETIGLAHFFSPDEFADLLPGFAVVEPLETTYTLSSEEAARRGCSSYRQHMWVVYAVK